MSRIRRQPDAEAHERSRRTPHGLVYRRAWWFKRLLNADSGYHVWRRDRFIGSVVRYGRNWFAALPDPEGRYMLLDNGDFMRFRDREGAVLALACKSEWLIA